MFVEICHWIVCSLLILPGTCAELVPFSARKARRIRQMKIPVSGSKALNRRELCLALPVLAMTQGITAQAEGPSAQTQSSEPVLSRSQAFQLEQLPAHNNPNGSKSWNILHGKLATGEAISIHESQQPAGIPPNPAHRIQHSEFIFVREGTLEFTHDGKSEHVGAGGVIFVAFGTLHSARNVGDGPASYCVIAIGGDTK